jgi:hypothetical protein
MADNTKEPMDDTFLAIREYERLLGYPQFCGPRSHSKVSEEDFIVTVILRPEGIEVIRCDDATKKDAQV